MDEDIAAFKRFARDAWAAEMKAMAPKIMQQPKTEPKPDIKLGVDSGKGQAGEPQETRLRAVRLRLVGAFSLED